MRSLACIVVVVVAFASKLAAYLSHTLQKYSSFGPDPPMTKNLDLVVWLDLEVSGRCTCTSISTYPQSP